MEVYHLACIQLSPGSIIEPGNFGRILNKLGWHHGLSLREQALEYARSKQQFAHNPSRFASLFASPSVDEAIAFRASQPASNQGIGFAAHIIYRVEIIDQNAVTVICDMNLCIHTRHAFVPSWADAYWRGAAPVQTGVAMGVGQDREILTLSPVLVKERLDA